MVRILQKHLFFAKKVFFCGVFSTFTWHVAQVAVISMLRSLIKLLGGRPGEEGKIFSFLVLGFFMGIFTAFLLVTGESLFVTKVGASEHADTSFFARGILGVLTAVAYVLLQRRMKYSVLVLLNFLFIVILLFSLCFAYLIFNERVVVFFLYIMMGPIMSIAMLSFWGMFGRAFNSRAYKRIVGGVDTGQLFATLISFIFITLLRQYYVEETYYFLWVSAVGSVGVLLTASFILERYSMEEEVDNTLSEVSAEKVQKEPTGYLALLSNRYYFLLSSFLFFSVCMANFNEFTYLNAVEGWYGGEEKSITVAVSVVDALIIILSFLIQTFVNDWIMGNLGLKVSLMIMPTILGIFTIGSVFSYFIFGGEAGTQGYFVFFTFNVMGRIFTVSLREALENPAFKMFFLPLSRRVRFDIQSRIEGVANQFSAFISGGVLVLFGLLRFFEIIYVSYILIFAVVCVFYVIIKLFTEYKATIYSSLQRQKKRLGNVAKKNEGDLASILLREIKKNKASTTLWLLALVERINPVLIRSILVRMLRNTHRAVRRYAYERCRVLTLFEHLEDIKRIATKEKDPALVNVGIEVIAYLESVRQQGASKQNILRLSRSHAAMDRKHAAYLLMATKDDDLVNTLVELTRDVHREVKWAAITSAAIQRKSDYWPEFIGMLSDPVHANVAASALVHVGQPAMLPLDMSFYRSNEQIAAMLRVVQILGQVGGKDNTLKIWRKVDYPNKRVFSQSILSLTYNGHQVSGVRAEHVKIQIEESIGNIVWILNAISSIKDNHPVDKLLLQALREENERSEEEIFLMMGLIYDPQSVKMVRDNLAFGTGDSVTYALELMDLFLDDSLKQKIFPLFDDISVEERLSKLSKHYVLEHFSGQVDVLERMMSRDFNCLSRWARALAIYRLSFMKEIPVRNALIASIFNPDYFLAQTAAYVLHTAGGGKYRYYTQRLSNERVRAFNNDILTPVESGGQSFRKLLGVERAIFLGRASFFRNLSGDVRTLLVERSEEKVLPKGITFIKRGELGYSFLRIILSGEVGITNTRGQITSRLGKGDVIGLDALTTTYRALADYQTLTVVRFLVISLDDFFDLATLHLEIVRVMIAYKDAYLRQGKPDEILQKNMA